MTELDDQVLAAAVAPEMPDPPEPPSPGGEGGWRFDKRGRAFTAAVGRKGTVYRAHEGETIAEAIARDQSDAGPRDKRPRRSKVPNSAPPPPQNVDLREIEAILVEAFSAPSMICATFGDEWGAEHFTRQAPYLARNLVVASKTNPWLRRQLETMSTGGESAMKLVGMLGLAGAIVAYAVPPVIYWANLPVPDKAREMFGVPDRRTHGQAQAYTGPVAAAA